MSETVVEGDISLRAGDGKYKGQAVYSPEVLKSYDSTRHIKVEDTYSLLESESLSDEAFRSAVESGKVHVYEFKGESYVDRLDIGRVYHKQPETRKGLTINRHFTDGEIDPFESVEWGRRDLEISDYKTKQVIFEMKDAEFPLSWNDVHASIVGQKYFYKPDKKEWKERIKAKIGRDCEYSPRNLITRVTNFIADEGEKLGYFATEEDKKAFVDELIFMQINQMFAFNSPVQFNAGLFNEYGIGGSRGINYWRNPETSEVIKIEAGSNVKPQCHACFIKGPRDDLESIAMHSVHEIGIFSSGSGIGQDIGALRGKGEPLSGGGKASGPLSFWKYYDDVGSTIKSGGKSRRAARMSTMRYHHPDILEFTRSKVREDKKALVLMQNGYEPGMDGEAYLTVAYQNTNISDRLDDYFFEQLENGGKIELRRVVDGKVVDSINADRLLKEISFGSWRVGDPGVQYENKIQEMHTCKNSGRINSSNPCSEYMFLDDSSCNLASLNLLAFCDKLGNFFVDKFKYACKLISKAQDILNDGASYPVESIAQISPEFRTIGLGYANLGGLLMRRGLAYDSLEGRAMAGAITALMTGSSYEASAEMAEKLGTFIHFEFNRKPMLEVMMKHTQNLYDILWEHVPRDLKLAAHESWNNVGLRGTEHGFRNAQTTVLAPTGTISYLMGCDTTGVEPSISLRIFKNLAGGGNLTLVNNEVPNALKNLGYDEGEIRNIEKFIKANNSVIGDPNLNPNHYAVFDTAFGDGRGKGTISFQGHVRMLGATQPFISGAISKTNNLPEEATVKDIYDGYILGHELGLKALAVFRNNSKPISALSFGEKGFVKLRRGEKEDLPHQRLGIESEVNIDGTPIHVIVSEYSNGRPGQIAFLAYKEGSDVGAMLKMAGIQASKALKRGVSLEDVLDCWRGHEAKPNGLVFGDPFIKTASSPLDYAAKWIALQYLGDVDVTDNKEDLDVNSLRGAQNGAFETYLKESIDDWDMEEVLANIKLGGFSESNGKQATIKKKNKNRNDKGVSCNGCGNLMIQTAPNCWKCDSCGDTRGGCGA